MHIIIKVLKLLKKQCFKDFILLNHQKNLKIKVPQIAKNPLFLNPYSNNAKYIEYNIE